MRIASILNEKEITLSCEVFPPKHFDGIAQASAVAQEIAGLHPSFMSVTYGAAGSTPGHTIAVAKAVAETGVTPLCHLTCVQSTREHVQHVLADMKTAGMENVLALRGDLPKEGEPCHDFAYAAELIDFIHQQGDFCVGAACGNGYSGLRGHHADLRRAAGGAGGEAVRVDYAAAVCGDCRPFCGRSAGDDAGGHRLCDGADCGFGCQRGGAHSPLHDEQTVDCEGDCGESFLHH